LESEELLVVGCTDGLLLGQLRAVD